MFLKFHVRDAALKLRGSARVKLDWSQKQWFLAEDDADQTWQRVGFSGKGSFERKPWGVIWLWDKQHNIVILWDGPSSETVSKNDSGSGVLYDPKDPVFKDGRVDWTIETPAGPAANVKLSALREKALEKLKEILPAPYLSPNWKRNPWRSNKPGPIPNYTSCGEFPVFVVYLLGDKISPGTTGLQPAAEKRKAWVDAKDATTRPLPGDLYVLCSTPRRDASVAHVGVIVDSSGTVWKTADWGQGDGFSGDFVSRDYDAAAGTLSGEVDHTKGNSRPPRALKGWVDLDKYFAGSGKA